jgi:hypothetical protein
MRLSFLLAILVAVTIPITARDARCSAPANDASNVGEYSSQWVPLIGGRYAYGAAGSTLGARAYYAYETRETNAGGLMPDAYIGLGLDVSAMSHAILTIDAASTSGVFRAAVLMPMGGIAVEATGGAAIARDGARAIGSAGIFWSNYLFDVGYAYGFPIGADRPAWLTDHQFTITGQVPLGFERGRP